MRDFDTFVEEARAEHHRLVNAFLNEQTADIARLAEWCAGCLQSGGKVLFFGNGGSAADAQHLAAEFVNRFDRDRPALGAIALTTDSSALTSIGNDSDFVEIFSRQVEALGRPGDVAIGITTSGNSPNVVRGLDVAGRGGLRTVAFSGRDGGEVATKAELCLVVPGRDTARIQEVHILAGHLMCSRVEDLMEAHRRNGATGSGS
jgi:D-sedoheptulose 7-phosphate isomerase